MHVEWGDWEGPDNAFHVVVLFDRRCRSASDTDAVASHDGRALFAVKIQEGGLHGVAVFGAKHKHMPDFDAFCLLQCPVSSRRRISCAGDSEVGKLLDLKITTPIRIDIVRITLIASDAHVT